jgi:hypothetical protein
VIYWYDVVQTLPLALTLLPGGLWCAWCFFFVRWVDLWPVLARGGWVGVLVLGFLAALVWSSLFPRPMAGLPNFYWQLGAVGLLVAIALLMGGLQGILGWSPAPVRLAGEESHPSVR